jgi:hypothetical protein
MYLFYFSNLLVANFTAHEIIFIVIIIITV